MTKATRPPMNQLRMHHESSERPTAERQFFRDAKAIVADLYQPKPWLVWTDLIVTLFITYPAAAFFLTSHHFGWPQALALVIAGFGLFRAGSFIHEVQHLGRDKLRGFAFGWNVLCGIPMLTPSFMYDNHHGHHRHDTYGTESDAEYLPLGAGPLGHFAVYFAQALLIPALVGLRFLFLAPLSFCSPRLRRWVLERFSYYGINPHYRRQLPSHGAPLEWIVMDALCSLRIWLAMAVVAFGLAPWTHIPKLYLLGVLGLGLNYVRNLTAHRYRNEGAPMSYLDQLTDSINVVGHPLLTELWYPLGLRYHALHHLFPTIPYHNLGIAHRRLMQQLPANSPYRATVQPGFFSALGQLWRDSRAGRNRARRGQPAARADRRLSTTADASQCGFC